MDYNSRPVSYTHLDVYKRQAYNKSVLLKVNKLKEIMEVLVIKG